MKGPRRAKVESAEAKLVRLMEQVRAAKEWKQETLANQAQIVGETVIEEMRADASFAAQVSDILRRRVTKPRPLAEVAALLIQSPRKPKPPEAT